MKPRIRIMAIARPVRDGVSLAIDLVGLATLAKHCGVSYQAVCKWRDGRIPAERCHQVVACVDQVNPGAVTLSMLRPDLWPAAGAWDRRELGADPDFVAVVDAEDQALIERLLSSDQSREAA